MRLVLQELRTFDNGSGFVFPSRVAGKPFLGYQKSGRLVKSVAKLIEDWNIYDLKSTCLTGWLMQIAQDYAPSVQVAPMIAWRRIHVRRR